jgi:hypothetical protein
MYMSEIIYHIKLYSTEKLEQNADIYIHSICQNLNPNVHFCRTVAFKKGKMNMRTKLHSKLQNMIKEMEEIRQFKRWLDEYVI